MHTATRPGMLDTTHMLIRFGIRNIYQIICVLAIISLSGCGGGGSGGSAIGTTSEDVIDLSGSVGDGPITGAIITIKDANDAVIGTTQSDTTANYQISVPADTAFPVTITATGGTDIVTGTSPDFTMATIAFKQANLSSKIRTANINPFSTLIVNMSKSMGSGLTTENIAAAKQTILDKFSFGLDSASIADPISSTINDTNVAGVVKASEALGEMIRRTRDAMITAGNNIDGDTVLTALANDLADGVFNGAGTNTDSKISATAKIASAQVLVEVLRNQLKVNNAIATVQLDNAILVTRPSSSMTTADVTLTDKVLIQTRVALSAAQRFAPSDELTALENAIAVISKTSTTADIDSALPKNAEDILDSTINAVPLTSTSNLAKINDDNHSSAPVAPVITSNAPLTARVGTAYSYDVDATDANAGDILTYELTTAPTGMTIDATSGIISWTPTASQVGTLDVMVRVTDSSSLTLSSSQGFSIAVSAANNAPTITSNPVLTAVEGIAYSYDVNASDTDTNDVLSYELTSSPAGMTIDAASGMISWTPTAAQTGNQDVSVRVTDNGTPALSASQVFTIAVTANSTTPGNSAPVITSQAIQTAKEGAAYSYDVNATDVNAGNILSYELTTAPAGMVINATNGVISWTPTSAQVGSQDVSIRVTDNGSPALSANQGFTITVTAANNAPVITSNPGLTAQEDIAYAYDVNATDPNAGDTLSYELTAAPAGMSINTVNGTISWTPTAAQVGSQDVSIHVTDNGSPALSASQSFTIVVKADNGPVIRVNAGGGEYADSKGQLWAADYGYNLGGSSTKIDSISGTLDDTLYQSERWHNDLQNSASPELEYSFNVPSGDYAVILHFAEITDSVSRIFDVEVEGQLAIDNLDIVSEVGRYTAMTKTVITTVSDQQINIRFPRNTKSPKISAIEVIPMANQTSISTTDGALASIKAPETNSGSGTLSIVSAPANGSVEINNDNILYTPNADYKGQETIIYSFVDTNGSVFYSSVTVIVTCNSCTKEKVIVLKWLPNAQAISGYRIYYGPDAANATEKISDVTVNSGLIDPTAPELKYAATSDLNYYPGEQVCFKIQAYKDNQNSSLSEAVCGTI